MSHNQKQLLRKMHVCRIWHAPNIIRVMVTNLCLSHLQPQSKFLQQQNIPVFMVMDDHAAAEPVRRKGRQSFMVNGWMLLMCCQWFNHKTHEAKIAKIACVRTRKIVCARPRTSSLAGVEIEELALPPMPPCVTRLLRALTCTMTQTAVAAATVLLAAWELYLHKNNAYHHVCRNRKRPFGRRAQGVAS